MKSLYLALSLSLTPLAAPALMPAPAMAQEQPAAMTEAERQEVVEAIASQLLGNYVFPETAEKMAKALRDKLASGGYASFTNPMQFSEQLTTDLRAISHDGHLRTIFSPEQVGQMRARTERPADGPPQGYLDQLRRTNNGFRDVRILDGNVAYLNLTNFHDPGIAGARETAIAAMNYVSNADALIIDLRKNGGGSPAMIQLIMSYLMGPEPVHLNTFYWRPTDSYSETWTHAEVEGKRRPDMDVYVLTSFFTFSAAEEFSYNMRNLKRGTLVGEVTGGGAHPGGPQPVTDRFLVWTPSGRAINPITKTNWEGTGVQPHFKTDADDALDKAYMMALEKLATEREGPQGDYYRWHLQSAQAKANPVSVNAATLASYVGTYGPRTLTLEDGVLHYQREGRPVHRLTPLSDDTFMLDGLENIRLQLVKEDGRVTALRGLYDNGRTDETKRDS
ncbi:S41 family peptidase [Kordiimonas lacus]|uniref:N-terminal domain of Peptidase_S41 n=1 Tax=Kordiimonas lacus TaxID=637679 RepID=A0A1G7ADS3_9PROT|nr:S41 family peptidase [Kordiimonas lacus]SDE12833.1 N-terminal domain of Peptidase_S41 [Kordiimonas lacus]